MWWQWLLTASCVLAAGVIFTVANVLSARTNARLMRLAERDSTHSSALPLKNTTVFLLTSMGVARFVADLRSQANDWRLTTTTNPELSEDCSVFYVTSESLGLVVRTFLFAPLNTSQTLQQLLSLESELQQGDRKRNGG